MSSDRAATPISAAGAGPIGLGAIVQRGGIALRWMERAAVGAAVAGLAGIVLSPRLMNVSMAVAAILVLARSVVGLRRPWFAALGPWLVAWTLAATISTIGAIDPWCGAGSLWAALPATLSGGEHAYWCGIPGLLDLVRGFLTFGIAVNLLTTEPRRSVWLWICTGVAAAMAAWSLIDYARGLRYGGSGFLRAASLGNANQTANFLVIGVILSIAWLAFARSSSARAAAVLGTVLGGAALLLTQSRPALAAAVVSSVVVLRFTWPRASKALIALAVLVLLGGGLWLQYNTKSLMRGLEGRMELWGPTVQVIRDHPLFGIGPRNFPLIDESRYGAFDPFGHKHAHNLYLTIAAEYGLVGLTLFLGIIGTLAHRLWATRQSLTSELDRISWHSAVGVVVAFLITGVGSMPYHSRTAILFWAVMALYCTQVGDRRRLAPP